MKDPAASKTRLADSLDEGARVRLARLLFKRTLSFLAPIAIKTGVDLSVVTESASAAQLALEHGFAVISEPEDVDLTGAVTAAASWAETHGFQRLCVIPADLAAPMETDLLRLLESPADVTICPSVDLGTNALVVSPPLAMNFHYGPRSSVRHREAAESRGLCPVIMPLESLSFDIDTSACLKRAVAAHPELAVV
ncbi:MAG: 2-phospho-L-lactate guanylyltransferase, partial [Pseudomonadota bacterium]